MKIKVYVVDLEIPPHLKRWALRVGILTALTIGGVAIAFAAVPKTWTANEVLTAADLNGALAALDGRLVALETAIGSWKTYSPVIVDGSDGKTPLPNIAATGTWRRVGDSIDVEITSQFSAAPVGNVRISWTLPPGLSLDASKLSGGPSRNVFGSGLRSNMANSIACLVEDVSTPNVVGLICSGDADHLRTGTAGVTSQTIMIFSFHAPVTP